MLLPEGGSTMSGPERARALRNVMVKVADVNGPYSDGVGHIGPQSYTCVRNGQLEKQKVYD
jgi:hypothetical protein